MLYSVVIGRKQLLKLEDVEYYAGRNKQDGPVIVMQAKDGSAEHPVGSYNEKTKKFKWDDNSLDEARQEELETLIVKEFS